MGNIGKKLADLRNDYCQGELTELEVDKDPIKQFNTWFEQALHAEVEEANAFTLATASTDGIPNARIVLLKGLTNGGFNFFTNYESTKGQELLDNPNAAMVFFWKELERQVRVKGSVEKVTEQESIEYFSSRPRGSRLGAWASQQSRVIPNREHLQEQEERYKYHFERSNIDKPDFWGGYRITPVEIEFWQGRPSRLHDRIRYRLVDGDWVIERLSP